jgi:broad specificity phosphatase PhoE
MFLDPYYHRFPGGENYQDLIERIEPIIYEIERSSEIIVVVKYFIF